MSETKSLMDRCANCKHTRRHHANGTGGCNNESRTSERLCNCYRFEEAAQPTAEETAPTGSCMICGFDAPFGVWYKHGEAGVCEDCRDFARDARANATPVSVRMQPCPFCGSQPEEIPIKWMAGRVACSNDECVLATVPIFPDQWNARVT